MAASDEPGSSGLPTGTEAPGLAAVDKGVTPVPAAGTDAPDAPAEGAGDAASVPPANEGLSSEPTLEQGAQAEERAGAPFADASLVAAELDDDDDEDEEERYLIAAEQMQDSSAFMNMPAGTMSESAARKRIMECLAQDGSLPTGAVSWAAGPETESAADEPDARFGDARAAMDFRMHGSRYPDTDLPGRHRPSGPPSGPYRGAWHDAVPPRSAREAREVLGLEADDEEMHDEASSSPTASGGDAAAAAPSGAAAAAAPGPAWVSGPGRARVDAVLDIIVQPAGSGVAADAAAVMGDVIERSFPGDADGFVHEHPIPRLLARARSQLGASAPSSPPAAASLLSARPSLGILRERGGAPETFHHDAPMGAQVASLNLARSLVRVRGPGRLLVDAAPREITASLFRVFSPNASGSFHHACSVLQRLVLAHPEDVAQALVDQGPDPLRRLMAFLHHPPVADTLVQLLTLSHAATAQGGAGLLSGPSPPAMSMFGAPPSDDELGALFKARPAAGIGMSISRAQARLHRALGEWQLLPELARHITAYGIDGAGWAPPGLFGDEDLDVHEVAAGASAEVAAGVAVAAAGAGAGSAADSRAASSRGGRSASVASESERAMEDSVRDGDEQDDPVAEARARGAGQEELRHAAEAAHVSAASDALIQCIRALREQGETAAEALVPLVREPTVRGLVEASCGASLAPRLPSAAAPVDAEETDEADEDAAAAAVGAGPTSTAASSGAGGDEPPMADREASRASSVASASASPAANPRVRPLRAGECSGATARSSAAVRCLAAMTELSFDEHLPDQGPTPMGTARVIRLNPFHKTAAAQLTATLITSLPRLASHLACVHECLHPGEAKKILRKPKKKGKKGKPAPQPGLPASALPVLPGVSAPTAHPGRYSVGVPFGVYRLEASKLLASLIERAPESCLSHLSGDFAERASEAYAAGVAKLRAEADAAAARAAGSPAEAEAAAAALSAAEENAAAAAAAAAMAAPAPEGAPASARIEPPSALGGWRGPGVWGALVSWAVLYPHSDSFHRTLERMVRAALLANHATSLHLLLTDCRLVDNLTKSALDLSAGGPSPDASPSKAAAASSGPPRTPLRALALRLLAMLRLSAQAEHRGESPTLLRDLLGKKQAWTDRLDKIKAELRDQRRDRMPLPPRPGAHSFEGMPPAIMAMIVAMQAKNAPPPEQLLREKRERESIDLGGTMARELGFGSLARDAAFSEPEEAQAAASPSKAAAAPGASAAAPPARAAAAPASPAKAPFTGIATSPTASRQPSDDAASPSPAPPSAPPPSVPPSLPEGAPADSAAVSAPTLPALPSSAPSHGPEEESDSESEAGSVDSAAATHDTADDAAEDAEEGHAGAAAQD